MVAPWVTTAQRSAGLRMFSQYASGDTAERTVSGVSWVFPRPWYQDELDWISASRAATAGRSTVFTTRGTYTDSGAQRSAASLPPQLFDYVAPSFARPDGASSVQAYSPLVSQSSYSAASVVAQSMQAIQSAGAMARGLPARAFAPQDSLGEVSSPGGAYRAAIGSLSGFSALAPLVSALIPEGELSRFSMATPSAVSLRAPAMVTPPSPRGELGSIAASIGSSGLGGVTAGSAAARSEHAAQAVSSVDQARAVEQARSVEQSRAMAQSFAQQRERVSEQMRESARVEQERAAAIAAAPAGSAGSSVPGSAFSVDASVEATAREAIREEVVRQEAARSSRESATRVQSTARQQARIDAIVAERVARLQVASPSATSAAPGTSSAATLPTSSSGEDGAPSAASSQALVQALRMAELLAHSAAIGPSAMAPAAGPRLALPTGLGGLVASMSTAAAIHQGRAFPIQALAATAAGAARPVGGLQSVRTFQPAFVAPSGDDAQRNDRVSAASVAAPWTARQPTPLNESALGAVTSRAPAALSHVAWSDRWLGRFAGASESALSALSSVSAASAASAVTMRARLAPDQLFVAPPSADARWAPADRGGEQAAGPGLTSSSAPAASPVAAAPAQRPSVRPLPPPTAALRFSDDDVVPDELFAAIAASSGGRRARAAAATPISASVAAPSGVTPSADLEGGRAAYASPADAVAMTAPSAPVDAGLSASLAASPMAPALGHVLSLPRAAVFDTRALAGAELAAAFLSGEVTAPMVAQVSSRGMVRSLDQGSLDVGEGPAGVAMPASELSSAWRQWSAEFVRPAELAQIASSRAERAALARGEDGTSEVRAVARQAQAPGATLPAEAPGSLTGELAGSEQGSDLGAVRATERGDRVALERLQLEQVEADQAVAELAAATRAVAQAANEEAVAQAVAHAAEIITLRSTLLSPASPRQQRLAATFGTSTGWANQAAADSLPVAYQTLGELLAEATPSRWQAAGAVDSMIGRSPAAVGVGAGPGELDSTAGLETDERWSMRPGADLGRDFGHGFPLVIWPTAGVSADEVVRASTQPWMTPGAAQAQVGARSPAALSAAVSPGAALTTFPGASASSSTPDAPIGARDFSAMGGRGLSFLGSDALVASTELTEHGLPGSMERGSLSPGMVAQRALGFGASQSSHAADLSFDFVPPELVLAARVYGFGAAEAAQAVRLAVGGSTGLSAMAGAVDLRFVSLANFAAQAAQAAQAGTTAQLAMPGALGSARPPGSSGSPAAAAGAASWGGAEAQASGRGDVAGDRSAAATRETAAEGAFGVPRRMPRGAFLFPSASVAAMGLSAALPEGEYAMPLAALEILAAKMVAELGSFASPVAGPQAAEAEATAQRTSGRGGSLLQVGPLGAPARSAEPSSDRKEPGSEASEAAVLSSAVAVVGQARRARFEALYLALAETSVGKTMSPAARAARALALANRDEESTALSSRERAALAWQIFPVVLNGEGAPPTEASSAGASERGGAAGVRGGRSAPELTTLSSSSSSSSSSSFSQADRPGAEMRPGLGALSARAGEALSSFVTSTPRSESRNAASGAEPSRANWRSGRFGGGEAEIPSWFEAAARKMFEERGDVEGISLADLTLVAAAPPTQIAAASRDTPAAVPPKQSSPDGKGEKGQKIDIEKVAGEVYRAVMQLMESARTRNGEPHL